MVPFILSTSFVHDYVAIGVLSLFSLSKHIWVCCILLGFHHAYILISAPLLCSGSYPVSLKMSVVQSVAVF